MAISLDKTTEPHRIIDPIKQFVKLTYLNIKQYLIEHKEEFKEWQTRNNDSNLNFGGNIDNGITQRNKN